MHTNQRWTDAENHEFRRLFSRYPRDFMLIAERMDKSYSQVRSHYYNIEKRERVMKATLHMTVAKQSVNQDQFSHNQLMKSEPPTYSLIVFEQIY
ncbi:SANT/Myb_domain [Hexamita inflata]|uniref:SANT/Myb domain n=1 Tax=Hexamita inflata TaxID=28002 RepID=A0AA86NDA2_9EUKA|nr:SANT/Myb domain [Hexamita inflata]CAI9917392.1 SANT/Myb domain [Hexamita inflata]